MMMGVALRYCKNKQEAEDVLQDSFIQAFDKIKTYKNTGNLGAWLRKITLNKALELYRKKHKTPVLIELDKLEITLNNKELEKLELNDLINKIQQLPLGFKTVFNLYAVEGYNHREIGELLNISVGTSKSQYSRARKMIQKMIIDEENTEKHLLKHAK